MALSSCIAPVLHRVPAHAPGTPRATRFAHPREAPAAHAVPMSAVMLNSPLPAVPSGHWRRTLKRSRPAVAGERPTSSQTPGRRRRLNQPPHKQPTVGVDGGGRVRLEGRVPLGARCGAGAWLLASLSVPVWALVRSNIGPVARRPAGPLKAIIQSHITPSVLATYVIPDRRVRCVQDHEGRTNARRFT